MHWWPGGLGICLLELESFYWERFLWAPQLFLTEHLLQEEPCPLHLSMP